MEGCINGRTLKFNNSLPFDLKKKLYEVVSLCMTCSLAFLMAFFVHAGVHCTYTCKSNLRYKKVNQKLALINNPGKMRKIESVVVIMNYNGVCSDI